MRTPSSDVLCDDQTEVDLAAEVAVGSSDDVVLVVGMDLTWEGEHQDREHLMLPEGQIKLIEAVLAKKKGPSTFSKHNRIREMDADAFISQAALGFASELPDNIEAR